MADSALSVTSALARGNGGGLPDRLVHTGMLDENALNAAITGAR